MLTRQLAEILALRYNSAAKGEQVLAIYLFGIEYAAQLDGQPLKEVCALAGLSEAYGTELSKAKRLAPFVELKK